MFVNFSLPITAAVTLAHLVIAQGADIEPARIFGSTSRVIIGQDFDLRCSTYGLTKANEQVFVYLCKNGVGLQRATTTSHDIPFTIKSATLNHTGNYSCVFSRNKHTPAEVNVEGDMPVFIKVIDFVHPAIITVDESKVSQGAEVEFRCTSEESPDTDILHAYLCKNHRVTDVNIWDSVKKQARFHMGRVQVDGSGNYSCVLSQRLLAAKELDMCGRNAVFLQVYESEGNPKCNENLFRMLCSVGVAMIAVVVLASSHICRRKDV
ncbi:uncharacterized protein LOC125286551 isoform X2 [Alosa alosa]|uniref:uncharacterized protein LOC125286551 isoform X2 n=1 Tax=Alosa alosa TaxID=278164 RepID=UPI00201543A6|nr:uncharacterized protein LOC125286551 isoform X2 [Alosa alosa]